jgi:hypothetical protein
MPGVFQNIDPLPPSPPGEFVPPRRWCGGRTHSLGGEGMGGQYFGRRQTLLCTLTHVSTLWCIYRSTAAAAAAAEL